jgi:hypothetical protein
MTADATGDVARQVAPTTAARVTNGNIFILNATNHNVSMQPGFGLVPSSQSLPLAVSGIANRMCIFTARRLGAYHAREILAEPIERLILIPAR